MDFDFDDDDDLWSESEEEKPPSEPEVEEHLKPTPLPPLIEQLKELSVFKGCTNVLLDVLSDWVQETRLEPGETVTMIDGDPFYLVRSGAVCVQVADGPTITLGPGTVLNMPGMLGLHAEAEPFKPKARHGGETDSSPGAKFLQLKDDLERIEALRAGSYEAYMPNALPSSVFAERKRSVGSMEARSATSAMDDAVCFWTLCPSSFVHQEHGRKTTDWLPLSVHGAQPGEMPTHEGGKIVDYEQGGALLATLTKNSIEEMIFTLGRTAENAAELRIEIDKFNNNWEDIANVWRTIISRCSRNIYGLPPEVSWALAEIAEHGATDAGHAVVEEGDAGETCEDIIIIDEGEAIVEKKLTSKGFGPLQRLPIGKLGPGAIIGDITLIGAALPRPAHVRANTMVETLILRAEKMKALMAKWPGLVGCMKQRMHEASHGLQIRLPVRSEMLASLRVFQGCDIAFLCELASGGERRTYYVGQTLKVEGSEDGALLALEYGECNIEMYGQGVVDTVSSGYCFGAQTILGTPTAEATVRVSTPFALAFSVAPAVFESVLRRHPMERRRFEALTSLPEGRTLSRVVSHIEVFAHRSQGLIDIICAHAEMKSYMPGQTICVQGMQDAAQMFVLRGGLVACERDGARVADLTSGATFGEVSMLGARRRRTASMRALTFSFVMEISRAAFLAAVDKYPEERDAFQEHAMNGMDEVVKRWNMLPGAPDKFVYLLNLYAERRTCEIDDQSLSDEATKECTILVLQGEVTLCNERGEPVRDLSAGDCWNEEALVEIETEETATWFLKPKKTCEVQIVAKDKWDIAMGELEEDEQQTMQGHVMRSIARRKAMEQFGLKLESADIIRMSALFRAVSTECAEAACAKLDAMVFREEEMILEQYEEGDRLCILMSGEAEIIGPSSLAGNSAWTKNCTSGQAFGEAELLGVSSSYLFGMRAKTLCVTLWLSNDDLLEVLDNFPDDEEVFRHLLNDGEGHPNERLDQKLQRFMNNVEPEYAQELSRHGEHVFVEPGGALVSMGDVCQFGQSDLFIILDGGGKAFVEGELRVRLAPLRPGDVVGEGGALGLSADRSATIRAAGPGLVHAVQINGKGLELVLQNFFHEREKLEDLYETRQEVNREFLKKRSVWLKTTVVPALAASALLKGWPTAFLNAVAAPLMETDYKRGQIITVSGKPSDSMLLLLEGEAEVLTKDGTEVGYLTAGACFGEVGALGLFGTSTADIRAICKCKVLRLTKEAMERALEMPEHEDAALVFRKLVESRRDQVENALPLSALRIGVPKDDLCARVIALQAEKMPLNEGEFWNPKPDDDMSGEHIGVFLEGKAVFESIIGNREITRVPKGCLFDEGLLHSRQARIKAKSQCQGYRIKVIDLKLALASCPEVQKTWYPRFLMAKAETRNNIIMQLNSVKGCVEGLAEHECDPYIHKWRGRKDRAIGRAQRMRQDKLDLPDMEMALCHPSEVAMGSRYGSTLHSLMTRSSTSVMSRTTHNSSVMSTGTLPSKGFGYSKRFGHTLGSSASSPDLGGYQRAPAASTTRSLSSTGGKQRVVSLPRL